MLEYNCPNGCQVKLTGSFGDDVHCEICETTFETEYEYADHDNIVCWIVKEI